MGRLRIAIADDDARVRAYVVYLVKVLGHRAAVQVEDGAKLVEQCLAIVPDLIISDMQMPGMTGLEAVDRIWAARPIPAILVSGLTETELFAGRPSGPKPFYLMKPFSLRELNDTIRLASIQFAPRPARSTIRNENDRANRDDNTAGRLPPRDSSASYPAKLSANHGSRSGDR
ncbi:MAG TPA: response regulator [Pirellulales bacterium]|jgi:CheY-like chemotaxis protein|nr:response regulator [Pirellulales bacterium]